MKTKKILVRSVLVLVALAALCACAWCVWYIIQYYQGQSFGDRMRTNAPDDAGSFQLGRVKIPVDFDELQAMNPDIYAWIRIPDTQIDYPVLQREEDDTYYLRHNSSRRYAFAGSIYTEEANSRDFKDPMTVLYGHNMRDGSMFQNLHFFEDETFFAEHPEFFIYLPGYRLTYEIFAAYRFDDTHLLGAFDFSKKKVRRAYIREVFAGISMGQNTREDVKVTAKDKLVTLSTCTSDQADGRYLVQAVLRKKEKTRQ